MTSGVLHTATAVSRALHDAHSEGRAALIGYLPAGFPSADGCVAAMLAMVEGGVDIIEVGLPYSDPLMDGPTIQRAAEQALAGGTTPPDVIRTVAALSSHEVPTLVMSYWNPIERYGVERFATDLALAGGSGVILPDLIPDEATAWLEAAARHGLDTVFLVAPSSTSERIAMTAAASSGFVYAASTMGVTGTRTTVGAAAGELVSRVRPTTDLPVCVGLGVSTGVQAAQVAAYADGVIVGSAFVSRLLEAPSPSAGEQAVRELAAELASGVRSGRPHLSQPA